jgi:glycosyltransferase involved in cell wall biosynthesis
MSAPLVSVVIPCYNAGKFIKRTISSILRNAYRPLEIVVVDDGSTDDSLAVVQALAARFPEVRVFAKENGGVSSARNFGIREAQSEYIAFLDADDLYYPDSLAKRMRVFIEEDEPALIGVYCPLLVVDDKGAPLMRAPLYNPWLPNDRFYYSVSAACVCNPSNVIVKKSKMIECGLFDETICPAEDYDLWHKMLRRGGYFRIVRDCLVGWVQHENSATHKQILHHQRQVKVAVQRLYAPDPAAPIPEYQGGYGGIGFHQTLSQHSFDSALMAVVSGHLEVAAEITRDIAPFFIEKLEASGLEIGIRISASRAHCLPETAWAVEIWPRIRGHVTTYFAHLHTAHHADRATLGRALAALEQPAADPAR